MRQFPQGLSTTECCRYPPPSTTLPLLHTRFATGRRITRIQCVSPRSASIERVLPVPSGMRGNPFWMNLER